MLDIKYLRDNLEFVKTKMNDRGQSIDFDRFVQLDASRRSILLEVEALRSERNKVSKEIGQKKAKKEDASHLIAEMSKVSDRIKNLDESLKQTEEDLQKFVMTVPNIPHSSVVAGTCSEDNPVVRTWGEKPRFDFTPKPHWELGETLGILDFARGRQDCRRKIHALSGIGGSTGAGLDQFYAGSPYFRPQIHRSAAAIYGKTAPA